MLDEDQSVVRHERAQELLHAGDVVHAHAGQRFVEQQQLWLAGQRHGDLEATAQTVAEVAGLDVGVPGQPCPVEHGGCHL